MLTIRYKLSFIASDGTAEQSMFCFENVAVNIIGKSFASSLASKSNLEITLLEIVAIVSLKFTPSYFSNVYLLNRTFSI